MAHIPIRRRTVLSMGTAAFAAAAAGSSTISSFARAEARDDSGSDPSRNKPRWSDDLRLTGDDVDISGTTDVHGKLQEALTRAAATNRRLILPSGSKLRISRQLVGLHGKSPADGRRNQVRIVGNDATLIPTFSDYALWIKPICPTSLIREGNAVANLEIIEGLNINTGLSPAAQGIKIGQPGYALDSFRISRVADILVTGSTASNAYLLTGSVRHIEFSRVVGRGNGGISLTAKGAGDFIGDLSLYDCEFSGSKDAPPIEMFVRADSKGPRAQIRGVHYVDCVCYGAGTSIRAEGNASLGDVWFNNSAFDGPNAKPGEDAINIIGSGQAAQLYRIYFSNTYIVNYKGRAVVIASDKADMRSLKISGGDIDEIDLGPDQENAPISVSGARDVSLNDVNMVDIKAKSYIAGEQLGNLTVRGCKGYQSSRSKVNPDFGVILNKDCESYDISHNQLKSEKSIIDDRTSNMKAGAKIAIANINK